MPSIFYFRRNYQTELAGLNAPKALCLFEQKDFSLNSIIFTSCWDPFSKKWWFSVSFRIIELPEEKKIDVLHWKKKLPIIPKAAAPIVLRPAQLSQQELVDKLGPAWFSFNHSWHQNNNWSNWFLKDKIKWAIVFKLGYSRPLFSFFFCLFLSICR